MQTKVWSPIQVALQYYGKAFGHKLSLPIFKKKLERAEEWEDFDYIFWFMFS